MDDPTPRFRTVNRILGAQPSLGPIPADQVLPWTIILIFSYTVGYSFLKLSWIQTILMCAWLMGSWWILTGKQGWRFLGKFISVPEVARGYVLYQSWLDPKSYETKSRRKKARRRKGKAVKS